MIRPNLNMRWLEVFVLVAKTGSIRTVAAETGLSGKTIAESNIKLLTASW